MAQLDEQLEEKATERAVAEMAELRIRNLLAFDELQSLNDTACFRCKHPLVAHKSKRAQLEQLLRDNPTEFLRKNKNCLDSIRRYESYLKRADRKDRRTTDRNHLREQQEIKALFEAILKPQKDDRE